MSEEDSKTIQKKIRERGQVIHADDEIQQDNLPVFFCMEMSNGFFLVVDMVNKDEIGILTPDGKYQVVNQFVGGMIFNMADRHDETKALQKEIKRLNNEISKLQNQIETHKTLEDLLKKNDKDKWPNNPYPRGPATPRWPDPNTPFFTSTTVAQPHVLQPQPIPDGTPMCENETGENREKS